MSARQSEEVAFGPFEGTQQKSGVSPVHFVLRCRGVQAYVMVASEGGKRIAFEPMTWEDNAWRLALKLQPGTYRYRYYVSDGSSTAYFSPSDADRVGRRTRMEGIDGLFDVMPSHSHSPQCPQGFETFTRSMRAGYSSLPVTCEGAFF